MLTVLLLNYWRARFGSSWLGSSGKKHQSRDIEVVFGNGELGFRVDRHDTHHTEPQDLAANCT